MVTPVGSDMVRYEIDNSSNVVSTNNQAVSVIINSVSQLTETGDRLNNVMSDNGNSVLASWLHAHGEDALYSSLKAPVSQLAMNVLGAPNLTTQPLDSQLNVVGVQVMDPTATVLKLAGAGTTIANDLNDSITGNSSVNVIYGLGGNDTINGGGGADTLNGGAGDDMYIVPNSQAVIVELAGGGNDTVIAKGDYTLAANVENLVIDSSVTNGWKGTGNELANKLTGNAGANVLDGGAGNDTIDGGAGNDTIIGGTGDDRLTGGVGVDLFRFAPHSGHDVITGFGAGGEKDVIDIATYKSAGLTPTLHEVGSDLVITFATGDSITVLGVHAHDLVATSTGWVF
jgi:Ca2+-binding RTX toxin-like protein